MTSVLLAVAVLLGFGAYVLHRKHRSFTIAYEVVVSPTLTMRFSKMQITAILGSTQAFEVIALGTQGEKMNVPVAFSLSNPAVADIDFNQASMTLNLTFKGLGTSDLIETASNGVTNTHTVEVTDTVASVDLAPITAASPDTPPAA
jgi:hypothetical protein